MFALKNHLTSLVAILCFGALGFTQNYVFIPNNQHLLTEEQLGTTEIIITPDVLLFSEEGQLLPISEMQLMSNPEYKPLFYADANGKIQSIVFQNKSKHPILIQKNPEAHFTKGELARDFIVSDINGNTIKLSDLRGKVIVLNFWFTQCGPCKLEMPNLNELASNYQNKNVMFLAVTFNSKATVSKFLETHNFEYTMGVNGQDAIDIYGVQSYPTSMVINQKGEIVLKELGYRTNIKTVLSNAIDALL